MAGGTFSTIIEQQFANLRNYGDSARKLSETYISDLHNYIVGEIINIPPAVNINVPNSVIVDPFLMGQVPSAPTNYPDLPDAPSTNDHGFPSAPIYTLPVVPTLEDLIIPDFIEGNISPLTSKMPISDITVPAQAQINDGGLTPEDALAQTVKTKLLSNIVNGGTMINPQVEADIWNRDLERREQALQDAIDKLTAQWAKLGWGLPDGLLSNSIVSLQNEYMNKSLDSSREIAVEQAKLEQAGMFKSLELATQFEQILIENMNNYAKRVFETSKATADETIEIFKARIELYNSNLAAFKTDVETYKIAVDVELAKAEVYKTRMMGVQVLSGVDEAKVKIYTTQMEAIAQQVDIFKTTVQSVALMYEAEKQKIEMYKTKVEAFTSAIDGVTKRYVGSIEGFKGLVQAYSASAEVQTKLGELDLKAQVAEVEATIKAWEIQLNLVVENTRMKLEALKAVAATTSNLAAGAMAGGHANVALQGTAAFEGGSLDPILPTGLPF